MKKELAFAAALPLALGSNLVCAATTTIDGTSSGSTSQTVSGSGTSTGTTLDNLGTNGIADIQVSAGVILQVQDGTGSNGIGANDIGVSSCHDGGSAGYWGDTGGGAVQKNSNFGTGNCTTSNLGVSTVSTS